LKKNTYRILQEGIDKSGKESLSVKEVLDLSMLKGYKILGGKNGLHNRCRHITILETPEGINWLEGGEFLATAGYAFNGRDELKQTMIESAYNKGVSAIAIKEGRYFGEVSEKLISDANCYGIPIIKIPYNVVYTEMVSTFYYRLFYRKNEYILNLNNIYKKLLNLSFVDKDINEIICSLSNISNSNVFLFDRLLKLVSKSIINMPCYNDVSSMIPFGTWEHSLSNNRKISYINKKVKSSYVSIYPVMKNERVIAYVYIVNNRKTEELEQRAIEFGVSIISSRIEKDRFLKFNQPKFKKTLADMLINNRDLPDEFYFNVEKDLGWDKDDGYIVGLCFKSNIFDDTTDDDFNYIVHDEVSKLKDYDSYLVTDNDNSIFVFMKLEPGEYLSEIVNSVFHNINSFKDKFLVSMGVSNTYRTLNNIEKMYNEAHLAVLFSNYNIVYFNSLDTIKLLYPLKNDDEIKKYYEKTIKKLEIYDVTHNANLVETLEAYFRYNMNNKITASKLFIHVETLRYRLNRIMEITGYSPFDSEGIFALQMGIKLMKLIRL